MTLNTKQKITDLAIQESELELSLFEKRKQAISELSDKINEELESIVQKLEVFDIDNFKKKISFEVFSFILENDLQYELLKNESIDKDFKEQIVRKLKLENEKRNFTL